MALLIQDHKLLITCAISHVYEQIFFRKHFKYAENKFA